MPGNNVIFRSFVIKFIDGCFLYKSLKNRSSSFFVPVQIKQISSMYLKYVSDFPSINGYMYFRSKLFHEYSCVRWCTDSSHCTIFGL